MNIDIRKYIKYKKKYYYLKQQIAGYPNSDLYEPSKDEYQLLISKIFKKDSVIIKNIIYNNYKLLLGLINEYNDYIIKYNDEYNIYYIYKDYIKDENNDEEQCISFSIDTTLKNTLYLQKLNKCSINGEFNLRKFEKFAIDNGIQFIKLNDLCNIKKCSVDFSLQLISILTNGKTRYNKMGYYSENGSIDYSELLSMDINNFIILYRKKYIEYLNKSMIESKTNTIDNLQLKLLDLKYKKLENIKKQENFGDDFNYLINDDICTVQDFFINIKKILLGDDCLQIKNILEIII